MNGDLDRWPLEPGFSLIREKHYTAVAVRYRWWVQDDDTGEWWGAAAIGQLFGFETATSHSRLKAIIASTRDPGDLFDQDGPREEITMVDIGWSPPGRHPAPFLSFVPPQRSI